MGKTVKVAFEKQIVVLPLTAILPMRAVSLELKETIKYQRIAHSIAEVGVIEPLSIAPGRDGRHFLLDGHVRLSILADQGASEVRCLIADDDEGFTYNKRINRLATIQEHYMIVRALERGVSEEKLARALKMDVAEIKRRRTLLDGVCPEVIELFSDKTINGRVFTILRKMRPIRQIEVAELMISVGNFSVSYSEAMLAATQPAYLVNPNKPKKTGLTPEQIARLERETNSVHQDFKALEETYGDDVLNLVVAAGYVSRLIGNAEIERFMERRHPDLLSGLRGIVNAVSLDQGGMPAT